MSLLNCEIYQRGRVSRVADTEFILLIIHLIRPPSSIPGVWWVKRNQTNKHILISFQSIQKESQVDFPARIYNMYIYYIYIYTLFIHTNKSTVDWIVKSIGKRNIKSDLSWSNKNQTSVSVRITFILRTNLCRMNAFTIYIYIYITIVYMHMYT